MTTPTYEATDRPAGSTPPATRRTATGGVPTAGGEPPTVGGSALLGVFAIPLGLAGLGGVWQALRTIASAPAWPAEVLFAASTAIWLALTVVYVGRGVRRAGTFTAHRQHAVHGPFAAYLPVIGILLSAHYIPYLHDVARGAVLVFVLALGVLAAQLVAHWLLGNLPVQTFHPGYFLPTVAGAFIASIGLHASGWHQAAVSAFGVGILFWLIIGTLVFGRLFTGAPLPDAVKPSLAVLVSPPAVAGIAWLAIAGGRMDSVGYLLLGILLMMLLVQVMFLPDYRVLSFNPNFWAFTFPVAASSNFAIRWLTSAELPRGHTWSWALAALATAFVGAIAAATVVTSYRQQIARRR